MLGKFVRKHIPGICESVVPGEETGLGQRGRMIGRDYKIRQKDKRHADRNTCFWFQRTPVDVWGGLFCLHCFSRSLPQSLLSVSIFSVFCYPFLVPFLAFVSVFLPFFFLSLVSFSFF